MKNWIDAMNSQAVAEAMVCSKSLARRRLRLSQAIVRSTTQRRGRTSNPLAVSDRLRCYPRQ
jgi:putative transposase